MLACCISDCWTQQSGGWRYRTTQNGIRPVALTRAKKTHKMCYKLNGLHVHLIGAHLQPLTV